LALAAIEWEERQRQWCLEGLQHQGLVLKIKNKSAA
jgi:hypothetical protein